MLRYKNRIWVGTDIDLQRQLISAFHDSPVGGHSGFPVTYRRIVSLFKWTGMKLQIRNYVRSCMICQQAKAERVLSPGLLQPLPIPSEPWEMASMDFIDGLPLSHNYDCILVVVDKLIKYSHFIPLKHPYTASKVADVFVDNIYRLHGMPLTLISDRDPVFTSVFWQAVFKATGTKLNMSTAHHPETDGQTERVNQSIECYLCCFISAHPKQWSKWLSLCEFLYNSNWHSSLGKSPFEVLYGRQPRYFGITASSGIASSDVDLWLQQRALVLASVRQHLLRMQQRMKSQADKNRSEGTFAVGDEVFLKLQPYLQSSVERRINQKLAFKFFGPFRILARISEVAYKLDLPNSSKVHPVFHVSQLKQCLRPDQQVLPQLPLDDVVYQIPVHILQRRVRQQGIRSIPQVLVQWSGTSEGMATWEDLEPLQLKFPLAPAWGQADFQEEGNVSDLETPDDHHPVGVRPRRTKRVPGWLAGHVWAGNRPCNP